MKFPVFDYKRPRSIEEAVALLAENPDARAIAGGQSLLPLMAFRLAGPTHLIDLTSIPGLGAVSLSNSWIHLGALVRWRDIERSALLMREHPLLVAAIHHVAHYQVRNLGTVGGALAHADPASEMICVAVACDGEIVIRGSVGTRILRADDFVLGPMVSALEHHEIITEIRLPRWRMDRRWAFQEFSRRDGDYAMAGVAVFYDEDSDGQMMDPHIALFGSLERSMRVTRAEKELAGKTLNPNLLKRVAVIIADETSASINARLPHDYIKNLYGALAERALRAASTRN